MPSLNISRDIVIQAPLETVFDAVHDFKKWIPWSPWILAEPDCKLEFAENGTSYSWDGKIIGSGQLTKTRIDGTQSMEMDLQFFKPWKSQSKVSFVFKDTNEGVNVTWNMRGSLPFFLFFMKKKMEAFVSMDYERGLKMLREFCETGTISSQLTFNDVQEFGGFEAIAIRREIAMSNIAKDMEKDMHALLAFGDKAKLEAAGYPFSQYEKWDPVKGRVSYVCGIPVKDFGSADYSGEVIQFNLPACSYYEVEHAGSFEHVANAWSAGVMRVQSLKLKQHKQIMPFELYSHYADEIPEDGYRVKVGFPLRDNKKPG
jgi:predicted transcriptional regulator YdeE